MHTKTAAILAAVVTMGAAAAIAEAQSAPTCSFDAGTATVTVTVNGLIARVKADGASGEIRLNGAACGGATVSNTDLILVNGGALADTATLTGSFAPGLTPEADAASEIEIVFALGAGADEVTVNGTNGADHIVFTAGGIDVGLDLDQDITLAGTAQVSIEGLAGDDIVDASAYTDPGDPSIYRTVHLSGGDGHDRLIGDEDNTELYGGAGNDTLRGRGGNDWFEGGPGNDRMYGGSGGGWFYEDIASNGADFIDGGSGGDVLYEDRTNGVSVSLDNGLADDGEPGEGDQIEAIRSIKGGHGDDVLVGSSTTNWIEGGDGADEIWGGAGDDSLWGGDGADSLFGEDGDDYLEGEGDADVLTGGAGHDDLFGRTGNDTIYNADGEADEVDCGRGPLDDAEPDPLDTIRRCEL